MEKYQVNQDYKEELKSINRSAPGGKKEYSRRYYQLNKEKWKEGYNPMKTIKRKNDVENEEKKKKEDNRHRKSRPEYNREVVRETFTAQDIQYSPVEKTLKMLEKIISGERFFTM